MSNLPTDDFAAIAQGYDSVEDAVSEQVRIDAEYEFTMQELRGLEVKATETIAAINRGE